MLTQIKLPVYVGLYANSGLLLLRAFQTSLLKTYKMALVWFRWTVLSHNNIDRHRSDLLLSSIFISFLRFVFVFFILKINCTTLRRNRKYVKFEWQKRVVPVLANWEQMQSNRTSAKSGGKREYRTQTRINRAHCVCTIIDRRQEFL